jgi:hypothetical protein
MAKKFAIPFAATGDKAVVPDALQPDGSVSYTQGFGPDYELDRDVDPVNAKDVPRDETNQLFFEVTDAIGEIQSLGAAEWSIDLAPYAINAEVYHSDKRWKSTISNNNSEPGVGSDWIETAVANATEELRGVLRVGTQAEVNAGALDSVAVTPKKLRWGFSVSLAKNGYIVFPTWLGGLVMQWTDVSSGVQVPANSSVSVDFSFPIAFPNEVFHLFSGSRAGATVVSFSGSGRWPAGDTVALYNASANPGVKNATVLALGR